MSAAWAKIHEDLNKSAFYLRVKQRAPLWQRMMKGGMFLAVMGGGGVALHRVQHESNCSAAGHRLMQWCRYRCRRCALQQRQQRPILKPT